MLNYFKLKFPDDMFKQTYLSNSINANVLHKDTFSIQKRPFIGMETVYTGEEPSTGVNFMASTPQYFVVNKDRKYYYRTVFEDVDNRIRIYTIPNRIKVTFNFVLKFQTQMAAIDMLHYIQNNFELNGVNYMNGVRLPSEVPSYFIDNICKRLGLDRSIPEDNEALKDYLISHSIGSINEVINPSTGNKTFMHEYSTNIMMSYPNDASSENNVVDLVIKDSSINFSIDTEIWSPSGYLLEIQDNSLLKIAPPTEAADGFKFNLVFRKDIIPKQLENGMKYIKIGSFVPEVNSEVDVLDIRPILSKSIIDTLTKVIKLNGNLKKMIKISLYKDNTPLREDQYTIDYDNFIVNTLNPEENATYNLVLYGNIKMLNIVNDMVMEQRFDGITKLDIF